MDKPNSQFDAEMLIVADREIVPESPLLVSVIDAENKNRAVSGPAILELLSLLEEIKTLVKSPQTKTIKLLAKEKIFQANSWLSVFMEQRLITRKLLETLMDGKVKVGLWIDSVGGEVEQEDKVNYALDYLDRNSSSVHSYVTVKAASAAFDLAFLSDQLSALSRSVFMWHFSDSPENPRTEKVKQVRSKGALDEETEEEMEDLIAILSRANPQLKDQLIHDVTRQLCHPKNPSGSVYLEGDYLHQVGLVNNCYRDINGLIKQFQTDFPIHADNEIGIFSTGIAQKVYKKIRHLPAWHESKQLGLTSRMQQRYEK